MIVLDTNVVSESLKGPRMNPKVKAWLMGLEDQPVTTLITRAELLAGVALLPHGHRRESLSARIRGALETLGTCLPLTDRTTEIYADCVAIRRAAGRPLAGFDGLIAATCLEVGASLATRNVADFEGLALTIVDPWARPAN